MTKVLSDDYGHLRKRAMRALSAESIRRARISALQAELSTLEADLSTCIPITQNAVEQLAKSECLALTNQVLTKLPRELRDMIYQHLSTRENEVISREHSRATLDPLTRLYGYDFGRWKAQHFPEHFWSTSYVGATFSQELVENYYRSSTFIFGDDPGVLRKWLATDEFKMGLLPKELVGSVEIRLNAVSHDRGSFRAYIFGVPKSPGRMQEALDGLFELKAGARVCVRFLTEAKTTEERDEHCAAAITILFPSEHVEKLTAYKVKFVVDEGHVHDLADTMAQDWASVHG